MDDQGGFVVGKTTTRAGHVKGSARLTVQKVLADRSKPVVPVDGQMDLFSEADVTPQEPEGVDDALLTCGNSDALSSRPLGGKYRDMLVTGQHGYPSRNEAVFAVVGEMVRCGWGRTEYYQAMTDPSHELGRWYIERKTGRTRNPGDTQRRLETVWAKVQATSSPISDQQSARQEIGLLRAFLVEGGVWTGRTAVVDRIVLEWVHQEATRTGRILLPLASRSITEHLGIPQKTATRALKRLTDRRWLRIEETSDGTRAAVYRLTRPVECTKDECTDDSRSEATTGRTERESSVHSLVHSVVDSVSQDVFLRLGRHAAVVYASLAGGALGPQEVQKVSGVSRRTVFNKLKILVELGLVSHDGALYEQAGLSLEKAAADMGATGLREARVTEVHRQREAWKSLAPVIQLASRRKRPSRGCAGGQVVDFRTGELIEVSA